MLCSLTLLALGCNTTARRIAKEQPYFDSLPSEAQSAIRAGEVAPGYTSRMVHMALGAPDRVYTRTTEAGARKVWSYTRVEVDRQRDWVTVPVRIKGPNGSYYRHERVRVDFDNEREYESIRIEFSGDKVVAIDTLDP